MRELLEFLVRSLVDDPQAVKIDELENGGEAVLRIHVAQGDVGKVIGRQGRTVKAIRAVLGIVERRVGKRVQVEIAEG
jgi:predicted RNA-binding protein YlqC (UPF0109 family)